MNAQTDSDLKLDTEFDRMLAPIKRKVFYTIGLLVLALVPFEAVLIFGVLQDSGKLSLQTFHGFAVGLGGLIIFAVSMLLVLLPTKLMGYKAYQKSEQAANSAAQMAAQVNETSAQVQAFIAEARETFEEVRKGVDGIKLDELRVAFERKIDELKDTIDENFSANDPVDPEALKRARTSFERKGSA